METKPDGWVGELKNELNERLNVVVVPEMSGFREQCIYKVPPKIRQINPQAYTPQVISIGPFHSPLGSSGDNILHQMEQLKLGYFKGFLKRTELSVDNLIFKFQELENRIRRCYAEVISFNSNDLAKIFIIDACFIVEHFLRRYELMENDPIMLNHGLFDDIARDVILLENQIPFFVLDDIYKLAGLNLESRSFLSISLFYLQYFNGNLPDINPKTEKYPKHFTDLLRTSLLPSNLTFDFLQEETVEHAYSVSQLLEAGLVFEVSESQRLLDLNFDEEGVLKMPRFYAHFTTESYLKNVLAFEECHIPDPGFRYISQYMCMLDFLIKTEKDVSILVDKKIIVNYLRDTNAVATMINNICKNVSVPIRLGKYWSVCPRLTDFYKKSINKYKVSFLKEYFDTPWKAASSVAALLLLLLTLVQTVCSIRSL